MIITQGLGRGGIRYPSGYSPPRTYRIFRGKRGSPSQIDLDDVPDDLDADLTEDLAGGTGEEGEDEDLAQEAFEAMTKGRWE